MTTIEFDARQKILGRLASEIAVTLCGKKTVHYRPDRLPDIRVIVHHAHQIKVTGGKETAKMYYHFSGYPGGLRQQALREVRALHPDRLLMLAVKRMLPKNKNRARLLKRLILETTD